MRIEITQHNGKVSVLEECLENVTIITINKGKITLQCRLEEETALLDLTSSKQIKITNDIKNEET